MGNAVSLISCSEGRGLGCGLQVYPSISYLKKNEIGNCFPGTWVKRFMRHYAVYLEISFVPPNACISIEARGESRETKSGGKAIPLKCP